METLGDYRHAGMVHTMERFMRETTFACTALALALSACQSHNHYPPQSSSFATTAGESMRLHTGDDDYEIEIEDGRIEEVERN